MLVEKDSKKRAYDAVGIAVFGCLELRSFTPFIYGIKKWSFSTIFYQPKSPTD
jgi:hypothetical protein